MATGTGPLTAQEVLNKAWNPAGTAPAANPDSLNVYVAGGSAYVGSGSGQVGGQPFSINQPSYRQFQLDGVALGSSSATGTTTTGFGGYRHVSIYVRFSTMTGTISLVDLYVDSRLDGTNYVNLAHLTQVTSATGGTLQTVITLVKGGGTGTNILLNELLGVVGDAGAGTIRNIGWGDDLRIRRDISGGTTAPIFSYTVWVNALS